MQKNTSDHVDPTTRTLTVSVDSEILKQAKSLALKNLGKNVKVQGFREGTAPEALVEKSVNPEHLAEEFANNAINLSYPEALKAENIAPIAPPKIEITKFVPFTTLEYKAEIAVLGEVKLADYKKLKTKKTVITPEKADIEQVLDNMRTQLAEKKDVERSAKTGDQAWINFDGKDDKGKAVSGAKGDNYPLMLGSNTFIPGFEDHVVGMKAGEKKEFTIPFPKDYGVKALQGKEVTFTVTCVKVQEVIKPELDEAFVKKISPDLSNITDLKNDIKKQLQIEADTKAQRTYENELVAEIVAGSEVALPQVLIDEQAENVMRDLRQNIIYRGQTMEEYLSAIGMSEEEQRQKEIIPEAERRLKAGVLMSEIAEREGITVTHEEIQNRVAELKSRYATDPEMQKQLDDPNNQRELGAQIVTEKTIAKIITYNN